MSYYNIMNPERTKEDGTHKQTIKNEGHDRLIG